MNTHSQATPAVDNHSLAFADVARVLGIGLVVMQHVVLLSGSANENHGMLDKSIAYLGVLGVAILFLLSGYLLGRPYLRAIIERSPLPDTRTFYLKRFLRIYPLYAFAVFVVGGLAIFAGAPSIGYVQHLLLVHNFSTTTAMTIEPPMWTMAVDAQFYLVLPIIAWLGTVTISRAPAPRRPLLVCFGLVTLALASVAIRFSILTADPSAAENFDRQVVYLKQLPEMLPAFAFGMLIALAEMTNRLPRNRKAMLGIGVLIPVTYAGFRLISHGHGMGLVVGFALNDAVAALGAALIFCGLSHGRVTALLGRLAAVSYAVYLLHWPIFQLAASHASVHRPVRMAELIAAFVFIVVPAAWLAHRLVELPFLNLKAQISSGSNDQPKSTGLSKVRFDDRYNELEGPLR